MVQARAITSALGLFATLVVIAALVSNQNDPKIFTIEKQIDEGTPLKKEKKSIISNDQYLYTHDYSNHEFEINDTEQLHLLNDTVAVIPKYFGYSDEEGSMMFPEYYYPP